MLRRYFLPVFFGIYSGCVTASNVEVLALFKGAALLKIDGREQLVKAGKTTTEGIVLISATPKEAVLEINGQRKSLGLSQSISGAYEKPAMREYTVPMNSNGQYMTTATINGQIIEVQVDTGANTVALSRSHAERLGIPYRKGQPSRAATASGVVNSWSLILDSVNVGGITIANVQASVIDAEFPLTILLGMTYLEHVEIRKTGNSLHLKQRY